MKSEFSDTLWEASQDEAFKAEWTEIKLNSNMKTDEYSTTRMLQEEMTKMYWQGVEEEVASAIIGLSDFLEHQPDPLPVETLKEEDFKTDKINRLIDLWNPLGESEATAVKLLVNSFFPVAMSSETVNQRRARSLLQALGLLDIDYVREYRRPVFRAWGQMAQVDHDGSDILMVARQCSECRHCIRSFHFYECRSGCQDNTESRNAYRVRPRPADGTDIDNLAYSSVLHDYYADPSVVPAPYRVCPACFPTTTHSKEHLKAVRWFTKAGDSEVRRFTQELDTWEDDMDGRFLTGLGASVMDTLSATGSGFMRNSGSRHFFPAGNAHCALMLGPLVIENGRTLKPGGAHISRRSIPNFIADSSNDLQQFLSKPESYVLHRGMEVPAQRHIALSPKKRVYEARLPVKQRRFLGFRKQVSGGLFTGYCDKYAEGECTLMNALLLSAQSWRDIRSQRLTQKEYREKLKAAAQKFTNIVRTLFDEDTSRLLFWFAVSLQKRTKLQYNRLSNNCQDFCNKLLLDDYGAKTFHHLYPQVPPNMEQDISEIISLRYLMSFSSPLDHPQKEYPFVIPFASSIQLYEAFGQNDADLIDHVSSIRFKNAPNGDYLTTGPRKRCHDEYLLKAEATTCGKPSITRWLSTRHLSTSDENTFPDGVEPCTLSDHLFDGPQDNLSVLMLHIHRDRMFYSISSKDDSGYEDLMITQDSAYWFKNRLEVLHRLLMINTIMALISRAFQQLAPETTLKRIKNYWKPPHTLFSRAWSSNSRNGAILRKVTWQNDIIDREKGPSAITSSDAGMQALFLWPQVHPYWQDINAWKVRLRLIKAGLKKVKTGPSAVLPRHWSTCGCDGCLYRAAKTSCARILSYAGALEKGQGSIVISRSHPDYVPWETFLACCQILVRGTLVDETMAQLSRTPEYYGVEKTSILLEAFDQLRERLMYESNSS